MQAGKDSANILHWFEGMLEEERLAMETRHRLMLDKLQSYVNESKPVEQALRPSPAESGSDDLQLQPPQDDAGASEQDAMENSGPHAGQKQNTLMATLNEEVTPADFWHPSVLVRSARFELFFSALIVVNSVTMALEATYTGQELGYRLGVPAYDVSAQNLWPGAKTGFDACGIFFGTLFAIELILKMIGLRKEFLTHLWNWFDSALVLMWLVENILASSALDFDSDFLRLLRLIRLMRLVRIARTVQGFDALVVMTTALQGCIAALFWVAVLLLIVQVVFSLLLGQILTMTMEDQTLPLETRQELFKYFGSFPNAMLTMFEITLGNFIPVTRMLHDHVSSYWMIFSIAHKVSLGFACLAVVNGVFISETFKVAHADDAILMREAKSFNKVRKKKMIDFFDYADVSQNGTISSDEWKAVLGHEKVRHWFSGQGLNMYDAGEVFRLLETDSDGVLTTDELVSGFGRLQGQAKNLDVALLRRDIATLEGQMLDVSSLAREIRQELKDADLTMRI